MKFSLIHCLLIYLFASVAATNLYSQTQKNCDRLLSDAIKATDRAEYAKSIELFNTAKDMAKNNNWNRQLYTAYNGLGINYFLILDYGQSITYHLKGYDIALQHLGPVEESSSLNNVGNIYYRQGKLDQAEHYYKKAYSIAKKNNLKAGMGICLVNLGYICNRMDRLQEARKYLKDAIPYLASDMVIEAKVGLIENDLRSYHTLGARLQAYDILENNKALKKDMRINLLMIVARSYQKDGNSQDAIETLNEILSATNPDLETRIGVFSLMAENYSKSSDLRSAIAYKDSIIKAEKKFNEIKNGMLYENSRVKFEIQNYKHELQINNERIAANKKNLYAIAIIFITIVIIIILFFRQKKIIAQKKIHLTELELEKEKNENLSLEARITGGLLEQERLRNEIDFRNRKLSARALYLSDRNHLIGEVISKLGSKPKFASDPEISNHIRLLKEHLKADTGWDDFITHFEEVNSNFLSKLKAMHPGLTANDMRYIAYLYMNLSVKEIASILNITEDASKKRKRRIVLKMGLAENKMLYPYLSSI